MERIDKGRIGVVIVVFHPDEEVIKAKLLRLGTEVRIRIAVVDNTPDAELHLSQANVTYIPLRRNTGIANAQNRGIEYLAAQGCTHIVFFDQDSEYTAQYVSAITDEYDRISKHKEKLFLLGPRVVNKTNGEAYRSVVHAERETTDGFTVKREIISSGSCASTEKLLDVGMLDARLFIDFVDFELCWRAEAKGYVCGTTAKVTLPHKVGERELRFPRGYRVIISAPFRYYYQYRNHLWLCRKAYVPMQWKVNRGLKNMLRTLYFPFCVKGWRSILKFMFRGIYDGMFKCDK